MQKSKVNSLDENIVILSMLGSRSSAQKSQSAARSSLSETEKIWCCVLDELSWLCDYRTGGKSVTSIAAQATEAGNVFWCANNRNLQLPIKRHLQWILRELRSYTVNSKRNVHETRYKLFRKSIVFSHRRVEFYYDRLHSLLACVKPGSDRQKDALLMEHLERMVGLRDNHEELCLLAVRFREGPLEPRLKERTQQSQMAPIWRAIRHYIGRLGSWWGACTILVSAAEFDAKIFLNCRVSAIHSGAKMDPTLSQQSSSCVPPLSAFGGLEAVNQQSPFSHTLSRPQPSGGTVPTSTSRSTRRRSGTYVHAELLVLNHFYRRNFAFAGGVPYVGCSKLSCFCCHIYMDLHPRAVLPRPCHGNTWIRWAMPVLWIDRHGNSSSQDMRLLAGMICRMQEEIEVGALPGTVERQLESTTGISGRCLGLERSSSEAMLKR